MARLSDDEIDEALAVAQSMNSLRLTAAVAELKERRAADLTSEELEALRFAINPVADCRCEICCRRRRALAALSKLTRGNR